MIETRWQRTMRELAGIVTRIRKDTAGNTIAIVAAALIPLTAMIGSGVDMSRSYMAQQKLQQACDAGALAGRRVMQNDAIDTNVTAEVNKFVNFNFPQATYQTASFNAAVSHPDKGIVQVQLSTTIPMTVMKMFGFTTLPLNVTCNASQNFVNTDVVLVLDTTGSMGYDINGSNVNSGPTSKIVALRTAVLALYDQLKPVQDQLEANGMRLRYGVVPYSQTVNVGKIVYAKNPSYMASSWTYQSRTADLIVTPAYFITQDYCQNASQHVADARGFGYDVDILLNGTWNSPGTGQCSIVSYKYKQRSDIDTSKFIKGETVNVYQLMTDPRSGSGTTNTTWNGCIEERHTSNTIDDTSGYTPPADANDLNIDMIPTSNKDTQWGPQWGEVTYFPLADPAWPQKTALDANKSAASPTGVVQCPTQARRLAPMSRGDMVSYLNSLEARGGTYHDIGMIWGARFISPNGIFKSAKPSNPDANDPDNPTTYNGMPVNRFVIFMTDGKMEPQPVIADAYGIEQYNRRTGAVINYWNDVGNLTVRHRQRFKMACDQTKGLNVSIWTVYFGSPADVPAVDTAALTSCASNPAQFAPVADTQSLIDKFVEIGKNIGALRLAK